MDTKVFMHIKVDINIDIFKLFAPSLFIPSHECYITKSPIH